MQTERKITPLKTLWDAIKGTRGHARRSAVIKFFYENSELFGGDVAYASVYGERGYADPKAGILFADWNYTAPDLGDYLEKLGFECEWCDEWEVVNDKAYRTSPDSYGWVCQIHLTEDGEYLTPDDDVQTWVDEMKDNPRKALPEWITKEQLEELGWERHDSVFENGLHPGQNDMPQAIYDNLIKRADVASVLFRISDKGQFDVKFEAYILPREIPEEA